MAMQLVMDDLVVTTAPAFAGVRFPMYRGLPPAAWATGLIAAKREGKELELWEIRGVLLSREYPERIHNADEARLVARFIYLAGTSEYRMAQLLDQGGLAILDPLPSDIAYLDERRQRRN